MFTAIRRMYWFIMDMINHDPDMCISTKDLTGRIATEPSLDDDVVYRARVRKRMIEGLTAREMPPLVNRVGFSPKEATSGKADPAEPRR